MARILLGDIENLERTTINPEFLSNLREQGPSIVYVFARGNAIDTKISLKELEEIEKAGFCLIAKFDDSKINKENLNENQLKLLEFFSKYKDKKIDRVDCKRLYFYFQYTPEKIEEAEDDVRISFRSVTQKFRVRNIITAIGKAPAAEIGKGSHYVSGWSTGKGGNFKLNLLISVFISICFNEK